MSDEREKTIHAQDEQEPDVEAHKHLPAAHESDADESDTPDVEAHKHLKPKLQH